MVAVATCVEPVALAVANDEMLRRMHDQLYELDGASCHIEWAAGIFSLDYDQLAFVLALPVGNGVDLDGHRLVRVA